MPRFLKDHRSSIILASLLVGQLAVLSLQVPLGDEPSYFEKAVFFLMAPLENVVHGLFEATGRLWSRYIYLRTVESQNQQMRDELFHIRQENLLLRNEVGRLKDVRELESFLAGVHSSFVVASVIGVDAANVYRSIVIDRGSRDGLKANMAVIDRAGNLVGRVVNPVAAREATVQLITDDNCAVNVQSSDSRVMGQLAGDAKNGRCLLRYVLATEERLAEGEELITTGYDRIFPAGIKAGRVVSISKDNSLFRKIEVKPYLDFRDLGRVAVLTATAGDRP
jgi:rod shape-determining protein MreC